MSDIPALDEFAGPVDYLVIEFPSGALSSHGFGLLEEQVAARNIDVLDVEFISKAADGHGYKVPATSLGEKGHTELERLGRYDSSLLDEDDYGLVADEIAVGSVALVLVYEERTLLPTVEAWASGGAKLVFSGALDEDDLEEALETAEAADPSTAEQEQA